MKELTFYFDFISPFSYFAWLKLPKLEEKHGVKIIYKPVALGPILNHWQIKGPGEVTPKREFLLKQMLRYADTHKIPFITPKTHPFNSLYALRFCLKSVAGKNQKKIIEIFWEAGWQKRRDMGRPEDLMEELSLNGLNAEELYEKSFSREAKVELKKNIEEAINKNVFGVPSFIYETELFWGVDSMDQLENFIIGKDNLDLKKYHLILESTPRAASQSL
jgi:2-hydroxychromene-2-carboxylate isomerase